MGIVSAHVEALRGKRSATTVNLAIAAGKAAFIQAAERIGLPAREAAIIKGALAEIHGVKLALPEVKTLTPAEREDDRGHAPAGEADRRNAVRGRRPGERDHRRPARGREAGRGVRRVAAIRQGRQGADREDHGVVVPAYPGRLPRRRDFPVHDQGGAFVHPAVR